MPRPDMRALPYFIVHVLPVCFALGVWWGGAWSWLTPAVIFVAIPLGDLIAGHDDADPEPAAHKRIYDVSLWLWAPVQIATLGLGLWHVNQSPSALEAAGAVVSMGLISGGGGINVAHELMHRTDRAEQGAAELLMTLVSYPWFCVEHILGHHRSVATPQDPATARLGQSLWAFVPRSIVGGLVSAWTLEGQRCARRGISRWSLRNRQVRHVAWLLALYIGIGIGFGWVGVAFFAAQSLVAVVALETINYVEHYGLVREAGEDGRPVRVQPRHSWNSTYRFTNWFTFNLQRHADHHAFASRPYDQLRACPEGPQLPLGYSAMMLLAAVPPLWFAVMDPRVREVRRT